MELKTRATVIKYYCSTAISICCRIYFVVNRHKLKETPMHHRHGPFGNFDFSLSLLTERLGYSSSKWRRYIWEGIYLFISYLIPSSSGYELQQSHEMDYVLRDEVYTRYLANTYFARKRSDVGCLYQIDTVYSW